MDIYMKRNHAEKKTNSEKMVEEMVALEKK